MLGAGRVVRPFFMSIQFSPAMQVPRLGKTWRCVGWYWLLSFVCGLAEMAHAASPLTPGYFNKQFNQLIRTTYPHWWGNWNLSSSIKVGAIGIIDATTGTFRYSGVDIDDPEIESIPLNKSLVLTKGHVQQSGLNLGAELDAVEASGNAQMTWAFAKRGSMVAQWALQAQQVMRNPVDTLHREMNTLKSVAHNNNMLVDNGIIQGFGVITSVIMADAGLSLGSELNNSEFQISGSAELLKGLTGQGSVSAGYYQTHVSGQVVSFIWPSDLTDVVEAVPIAFTFSSIDGERVIPNWLKPISFFEIKVNNHGNYSIHADLDYECPETGKTHRSASIYAYSGITLGEIPLDATNVDLILNYRTIFNNSETKKHYFWKSLLGIWPVGNKAIDISGHWPHDLEFTEK